MITIRTRIRLRPEKNKNLLSLDKMLLVLIERKVCMCKVVCVKNRIFHENSKRDYLLSAS